MGTPNPDPTPVMVVPQQEPIPVILTPGIDGQGMLPNTVTKGEGTTLRPTTTEAQDAVSEGQRRINLIWENTQSRIALMVVTAGVVLNSVVVLLVVFLNRETTVPQLSLISICLQFINLTVGIVIGFYFSRVNHQAIGGIGPKPPEQPYTGR